MENTLRLDKVLSKNQGNTEFLMNTDSSFTESSNESLELLMTTYFSNCKDEVGEESELQDNSASSINISELVISMINEEKLAWTVSFFDRYKSAEEYVLALFLDTEGAYNNVKI